jgi:hypothetical protein
MTAHLGRLDLLLIFLTIPIIGIFDYYLFRKWTMCLKCGHQLNAWYSFIDPTFIEVTLFISGIAIGIMLK